ncbi:MAG TPA: site-specific integrase, partial [Pirellulales bacterium]
RAIYGDTKKEVQQELAKLQHANDSGMLCNVDMLNVTAYLTKWLNEAARPSVCDTTFSNYEAVVNNHISPRIGGIRLQKLTPLHVQSLYSQMEADKVGGHTRLLVHIVLHAALDRAIKWQLVPRNVCDAVERPVASKADIQPLTTEQTGTLFNAVKGNRLEALYILAVSTGMRLGELFGLQWSDVDLKAGTVTIHHTLQELDGHLKLKEPKTKSSRRKIDLTNVAIVALHDHRKRMMAEGHAGCQWVFCNQSGGNLRRSHFHRAEYKPLLKAAGLPAIRFHDLRHTHATIMLSSGENVKVVSERMGHSSSTITLDTYSHVMPGMQKAAAGRLDSLLTAAAAAQQAMAASVASA